MSAKLFVAPAAFTFQWNDRSDSMMALFGHDVVPRIHRWMALIGYMHDARLEPTNWNNRAIWSSKAKSFWAKRCAKEAESFAQALANACKNHDRLRRLLAAKRMPMEDVILAICTEFLHPDHLIYVRQAHLNHPFIADTLAVAFDKAISMYWPCWPNQKLLQPQNVSKGKHWPTAILRNVTKRHDGALLRASQDQNFCATQRAVPRAKSYRDALLNTPPCKLKMAHAPIKHECSGAEPTSSKGQNMATSISAGPSQGMRPIVHRPVSYARWAKASNMRPITQSSVTEAQWEAALIPREKLEERSAMQAGVRSHQAQGRLATLRSETAERDIIPTAEAMVPAAVATPKAPSATKPMVTEDTEATYHCAIS